MDKISLCLGLYIPVLWHVLVPRAGVTPPSPHPPWSGARGGTTAPLCLGKRSWGWDINQRGLAAEKDTGIVLIVGFQTSILFYKCEVEVVLEDKMMERWLDSSKGWGNCVKRFAVCQQNL